MFRKSSIWFVVLVSIVALAFVATGCAKKQVVKEESAAKPMAEVKKEEVTPAPAPAPMAPKEEMKQAPAPPAPMEEAKKEAAPPTMPAPIDLTSLRIWFAFDDYNLSTQSKENLEKVANWLSKTPATKIQIQGNTCDIGTAEYNLALGERRASSAKKYLEGLGVSPNRLSTISYGLERPLVPNSDEGNRSKNRRDDFVEMK